MPLAVAHFATTSRRPGSWTCASGLARQGAAPGRHPGALGELRSTPPEPNRAYKTAPAATPRTATVSAACRRLSRCVPGWSAWRSEEHTSELQSRRDLVCRLLLEKKK